MAAVSAPSLNDKTSPSKSKYRPEIDGLRAFAVVAVIINHFNKDLLPSGYLGVDIFFVISGYVITSSLANRQSKNFLDFVTGFYERRIKRLVPALVVFVLITSVLISFFSPDPKVPLATGWRSLIGMSNNYLYQTSTNYFAESAELNPFTHTWSLGVEEQFYLLFPFLIWFSGFGQQQLRGSRNLVFWVGALMVASLISFIYLYQVNQPAAYFLMPPRFWEMATGCLIFIGFQKRAKIEQALEQVPPLLVVAVMVGVMFLPTYAAVPATISVVVLSAILIACLKPGTAAYDFFTVDKVVYVGLTSYSLYLWHWSVLCISRWTIGVHWWSAPIQVAAMLLLAMCSRRWIETPIRKETWAKKKYATIYCGASLLLGAAVSVKILNRLTPIPLFLGDYSREEEESSRAIAKGTKASGESCSWWNGGGPTLGSAIKNCTITSNMNDLSEKKKYFILGDSHAGNLMGWIEGIPQRRNISARILYVHCQSAPPIRKCYQLKNDSGRKADEKMQSLLINDTLLGLQKGDTVILSNYLLDELGRSSDGSQAHMPQIKDPKSEGLLKSKFRRILDRSKEVGANVVILLPLPDFKENGMQADMRLCTNQWYRNSPRECHLKARRDLLVKEIAPIKSLIYSLQKDYPDLYAYNPFEVFCSRRVAFCSNYAGKRRTFLDGNHLNLYGSRILAQDFNLFLRSKRLVSNGN